MPLLSHYIHTVNPKLKHTYLSFNDEGTLLIKSPKISARYLEKLLLKKASWINSARQRIKQKKGKSITFNQSDELYYLGQPYRLNLVTHEKKRSKLLFDGSCFTLYYSMFDTTVFQRHIDSFYKQEATKYIPPLVHQWSETMSFEVADVRFRKTKRQWGSCSSRNTLSFNTMMMKLPADVIHYIVVHELAHIKYKHHQKTFWQCVERYLPSYKTHVQELKKFTT